MKRDKPTFYNASAWLTNFFRSEHLANPASLECNETRILLLGSTLSLQIMVKLMLQTFYIPMILLVPYTCWSMTWLFSIIYPRARATTKRVGETFCSALKHSTASGSFNRTIFKIGRGTEELSYADMIRRWQRLTGY